MYQILLVDDEILYLEFLNTCIEWKKLNCTIMDIATSGEEAIEKLQEHNIDIIFLDINLGTITGLDVCKEIREQNIQTEIVIMTAHDEFSFAKQAITYNVADYLLKPFDYEEIQQAIKLCEESIYLKRETNIILQGQEILGIINNEESRYVLEKISKYKNLSFIFSIIKLAKREYYESTLANMKEVSLLKEEKIIFLKIENNYLIYIHQYNKKVSNLLGVEKFYKNYIEKFPDTLDKVVLSDISQELIELKDTYDNAMYTMENSFKFNDIIIKYSDIEQESTTSTLYSISDIEALYISFKENDIIKIDCFIERIFGLSDGNRFSFQYVYVAFHSILLYVYSNYGNVLEQDYSNFMMNQQQELIEHISSCSTNQQVKRTIKSYIEEIFVATIVVKNYSKKDKIYINIENHLKANFSDQDLSISSIANALYYEGSYIRRVYKEQAGKTIMNRLEEIRLEHAKHLLNQNRTLKLAEIAKECGFSEPYYFSKRFKKYYGVSPFNL